ncbi:MAG: hypothetical protein NDJ90_07330 [Oligoflexia bacterium]|nr:hypothetical protein [Oligoflexia bacterium]
MLEIPIGIAEKIVRILLGALLPALAALLLLWAVRQAQARERIALGYTIEKDSSGALVLRGSTDAPVAGMWLGVTLHAPTAQEAPLQLVFPLKAGHAITPIRIDSRYASGTFEAALWTARLEARNCDPSDEPCQKQGYRLLGMKSYVWGQLLGP